MKTFVVAEDHPFTMSALKLLLAGEEGWRVIGEATDGLTALRAVMDLRPDVLVTDLMLPGLNGLEVARAVRRQFPNILIVVVSSYAEAPYVTEALQVGVQVFVDKGLLKADLVVGVHAALQGQRFLSGALPEVAP